jgi:hypothetical protein
MQAFSILTIAKWSEVQNEPCRDVDKDIGPLYVLLVVKDGYSVNGMVFRMVDTTPMSP